MKKIISRHPDNSSVNGWSSILPGRHTTPRLSGETTCDWLVIGAGFSGLAAARRLGANEPSQRIVLIDAGEVGENASGRNSGFGIDIPHNMLSSTEGSEAAKKSLKLARSGIGYINQAVEQHNIDCDWTLSGKYHVASSARGADKVLRGYADELDWIGEPNAWHDRESLYAQLGTSYFHAGVYTPGCYLTNPAALCRGLADSLPDNVELFENSPIVDINYGADIVAKTQGGGIRAGGVIICVNGFAPEFGHFPGRLLSFAAYATLTRPLTNEEQTSLNCPAPWGTTPVNSFAGVTMRLTNDHRILIRQDIRYSPRQKMPSKLIPLIQKQHMAIFHDRFPNLPVVKPQSTWFGNICLSGNGAPGFARLSNNVYSAVCHNGVGLANGTISGVLAADWAVDRDNPMIEDLCSLGEPSSLPPNPFLDIGVRSRLAWELLSNRQER